MRSVLRVLLWVTVLPVLLYTAIFYGVMPAVFPVKVGWQIDPALQSSLRSHSVALYLHIVPSAIALGVGLVQLGPAPNTPRPPRHRLLGRVYVGAVLIGGLAGLYLSVWSFTGIGSALGFAALSLAWLYTTGRAARHAMKGEITAHRAWMIRSYALTLAGVTLRVYNQMWFAAGYELSEFHVMNAWLCWVPNLLIAELILRRQVTVVGGAR